MVCHLFQARKKMSCRPRRFCVSGLLCSWSFYFLKYYVVGLVWVDLCVVIVSHPYIHRYSGWKGFTLATFTHQQQVSAICAYSAVCRDIQTFIYYKISHGFPASISDNNHSFPVFGSANSFNASFPDLYSAYLDLPRMANCCGSVICGNASLIPPL